MKLGGKKNLLAIFAIICMMLSSQMIQAQNAQASSNKSGGNASQGQRHGIPSRSWSESTDMTSSKSTRSSDPAPPGQWSPKARPLQDGSDARSLGESGNASQGQRHGIPSRSWSESTDMTSSKSTRSSDPAPPGQWSPKARPLQDGSDNKRQLSESERDLQEVYYEYTYTTEQPQQVDYTYTESYGDKNTYGEQLYIEESSKPTIFSTTAQQPTFQKAEATETKASAATTAKATVTPTPAPKPVAPKAEPAKAEPPKAEHPKAEPLKQAASVQEDASLRQTHEDRVHIPQIKYITLDQIKTGTFEWPIVRKTSVTQGMTIEKTVSIPQIGFIDLCQEHPTTEHEVSLITVHSATIQQIVQTNECDVELIQVHTVWIPVMGDINIVQHSTKSRRVHLKQEWDCSIKCEDTRIHFLQLPQQDEGISGSVVVSGNQDDSKSCYSCQTSKCAGVGPALLPVFMDEVTPVSRPAPVVVQAPPPPPEIKIVEVIKEVCTKAPEPTEIHHIRLGMCPCKDQAVVAPLNFAETSAGAFAEQTSAYAGAFKWWMLPLILLGLLLLSMLLAWLLCFHRRKTEKVQVEKKVESPQKKFIIEKKTKEEDEEEIEREIARTLQARVDANKRDQVRAPAPAPAPAPVVREEEKKVEAQAQVQAPPPAARQEAAPAVQEQNRALQESPGGSQNSEGRQRSSRGSGSSKKVVKKRIVKMMKQGKLVAEKEEILDEEGNVIRTEIRKEGLSSGSPNRSQA